MTAATIDAHFELYGCRDGRWVLEACFADEDEGREEATRLARSAGVRGARLVREVRLPGVADPIVTVLLDTTDTAAPIEIKAPRARSAHDGGRIAASGPAGRRASIASRLHVDPPVASALPKRLAGAVLSLSLVVAMGVAVLTLF